MDSSVGKNVGLLNERARFNPGCAFQVKMLFVHLKTVQGQFPVSPKVLKIICTCSSALIFCLASMDTSQSVTFKARYILAVPPQNVAGQLSLL